MKSLYIITLFSIIAGINLRAADVAKQIRYALEANDRNKVCSLINADNINTELPPL